MVRSLPHNIQKNKFQMIKDLSAKKKKLYRIVDDNKDKFR